MILPDHLIVVCCHAIYLGPDSTVESSWLIEPFQAGETGTYISHIEAGLSELARDERSILVFSGGATKRRMTPKTEAEGYLNVAIERNLYGLGQQPSRLHSRIFLDRFATDSYQNVLCSLTQFPMFVREWLHGLEDKPCRTTIAGGFPHKLTIISHEFKRARFLDLHLPALRWRGETAYIGLDPPFDAVKMDQIESGERLRGFGAWRHDLYGADALLCNKRRDRGWDEAQFREHVVRRLPDAAKEGVERFLLWTGGPNFTTFYPDTTPWQ